MRGASYSAAYVLLLGADMTPSDCQSDLKLISNQWILFCEDVIVTILILQVILSLIKDIFRDV